MSVLLILLASSPAAADRAPRNAAAVCRTATHVALTRGSDGVWTRDGAPDLLMSEVSRADLDGDGRRDLIVVWHDGCGTRECVFQAFVACRDGTFAEVMNQYAARVKVSRRKHGWARLRLEHVGDYHPDRERERIWSTLRMGAGGYQ